MNHRLEQIEDLRAILEMRRDRPNSLDGPPLDEATALIQTA
jgi:hypothetical protein